MATRRSAILAGCLLVATIGESHADDNRYLRKVGTLVEMKDLPGVERPEPASPLARLAEATTAELPRRERPDPDRTLPAGLRVTTRCRDTWCADGLLVGKKKTLIAPEPRAADRGWLRKGWLERVVRVVWQDEKRVSVYVAESWFEDGSAHVNNALQCRTFDLRSGRVLALADVLPGGAADRALAQARRQLASDDGELGGVKSFKTTKGGFRFRAGESGGDGPPDVVVCAQGPYPSESGTIVEMKVPAAAAGSTR